MGAKVNVLGIRFGKLVVISECGRSKYGQVLWRCQCDCGKQSVTRSWDLKDGSSRSCGCGVAVACGNRSRTHGKTKSSIYKSHHGMKQRCLNPKNPHFDLWGGRGIKICARWMKFENFLSDMGASHSEGMEIERRDNNGNYEPSNCIWITCQQQQRNKRTNHLITINGKTKIATEWAESSGISVQTIFCRIRAGDVGAEIIRPVK